MIVPPLSDDIFAPDEMPEKINQRGLYLKALYYCGRYGGTAKRVEQILHRYIRKYAENETQISIACELIPEILTQLRDEKFIDDALFAEARIETRLRKGDSFALLRERLAAQGIAREDVTNFLHNLTKNNPDAEYQSLKNYAKKRGIVPHHLTSQERSKASEKLTARGFPYALIRRFCDEA